MFQGCLIVGRPTRRIPFGFRDLDTDPCRLRRVLADILVPEKCGFGPYYCCGRGSTDIKIFYAKESTAPGWTPETDRELGILADPDLLRSGRSVCAIPSRQTSQPHYFHRR